MADKFVIMHGKALDGSDEIHQQEVHEGNVEAFKRSGWVVGEIPKTNAQKIDEAATALEALEKATGLSSGIKIHRSKRKK